MANIRLEGADEQRRDARPAERLADGGRFDRIADGRAGPVRLDEGQRVEIESLLDIELLQEARLVGLGR